jgi:hypothetical protein
LKHAKVQAGFLERDGTRNPDTCMLESAPEHWSMQEYALRLILSRFDGESGEHMTGDQAAADKNLADLYRKFS